MKPRVPSRRRGMFGLSVLFVLLTFLFCCPASARLDVLLATEGDPGDGNLLPSDSEACGGGLVFNSPASAKSFLPAIAPGGSLYLPVLIVPQDLTLLGQMPGPSVTRAGTAGRWFRITVGHGGRGDDDAR